MVKLLAGDKCKIMGSPETLVEISHYSLGLVNDFIRFKSEVIISGEFVYWHWLVLKLGRAFIKK